MLLTMGCEIALDRAWNELNKLSASEVHKVAILTEEYDVNLTDRLVTSRSSGIPAENGISLLILHYLIGLHKYGYRPTGEWISFNEIWGGISYYPSFRKRTIEPLIEMMRRDPEDLINNIISVGGKVEEGGDLAMVLSTFPGIQIKIVMWRGEGEIPPEVTMLFDKSLADILMT
jgi:Domain of unknown function (DUF3786)